MSTSSISDMAVAAADHGSFRRAAEALLLRQSKLSRCIRQLEERIEIAVFERSSGGVRATQAGRDFLRMARSILEQIDTLLTSARSAGRGEVGRLAIGFYTSLAAGYLRSTIIDHDQRFPQIQVRMIESSRTRLTTALRNGAKPIDPETTVWIEHDFNDRGIFEGERYGWTKCGAQHAGATRSRLLVEMVECHLRPQRGDRVSRS